VATLHLGTRHPGIARRNASDDSPQHPSGDISNLGADSSWQYYLVKR
jgi:hypothetical protein